MYNEESFPIPMRVQLKNGKHVRRKVYWTINANNKKLIYIKDKHNKKISVTTVKDNKGWKYKVI